MEIISHFSLKEFEFDPDKFRVELLKLLPENSETIIKELTYEYVYVIHNGVTHLIRYNDGEFLTAELIKIAFYPKFRRRRKPGWLIY